MIDAAENSVTYDYDARGMFTAVTDAGGGKTVYESDCGFFYGTPDGKTAFGSNWLLRFMHRGLREIKHYNQDKDLASKYNNVEVYDIIELSTKRLRNMINGSDVTICAWCYSERSRDVIKAIKSGG